MSRKLHPDTIPTVRKLRPDLRDLPDRDIEGLYIAQHVSLNLHARDAGHAFRASLPRPLRRLLGDDRA